MYSKYAELRDKKGITDYAVAKHSGVGRSTLSDWKTGKHTPDPVNIKKLANFFNVPISYFYDDDRTNISDFKSAADIELDDYIEMLKNLPPERRKSIYEQIEFQNTKEANSRS